MIVKSYQKILRKWMKAEHDVRLLYECKSHNVYSKFAKKYQKQNTKIKKQLLTTTKI